MMGRVSRKFSKKRRKREEKVAEIETAMNFVNAVKMASMLVLRNEGWGHTRLLRFSTKFDEVLSDVSAKRLSLSDIPGVLEEETGLKIEEIVL